MNVGHRLGAYRIDRELGAGGMGKVYAATGPEGVVALKVVHPHLLQTADVVERFRREVEIGRAIEHPNVVRTFAGGQADGHYFLAMEYVEGQTLEDLLVELERVPEELCRHIGREFCKGLAAVHAAGAVHRDMKPENVLITPEHVVKVMDLGVARSTDDALRLSQTGAFVGSLQYACPEQFTGGGKGLDGRVDLHALGLVLYELSSGVSPYVADDVPETLRKVLHEEPRRLGELNPQLSAFFEEVVHRLLAKDRDERFASAEELLHVLESGEDSEWWIERARVLQLATQTPLRRVRIPRETAVYGRDVELTKLRSLYERASAGEGQVVLVEGEAGVGKSRLVDEFVRRLHEEGESFHFLVGTNAPNGAATAMGAFAEAFGHQLGDPGSAAHLTATPGLVPAFDALLRGEAPPPGTPRLPQGPAQGCFEQVTRSLAADRPTVVLIDDLHFAPDRARALFSFLASAATDMRVLLIGTTRPDPEATWQADLERFEHTTRIAPGRLAASDLADLLRDAFGSQALAEALGFQIIVKSDGNPFFAFEIIRDLREGHLITRRDDGRWASTGVLAEIEIPSSIREMVNARVARLDDDARNLLDVAACWGFQFDAALVAEALGMRRLPVLQMLARIEKRDRLVRSVGRRFTFDHHQVQEVLYESLPEMLREEYHGALAEVLEGRVVDRDAPPQSPGGAFRVDIATHFLAAGRGADARPYIQPALTHLVHADRASEALVLAEQALAVPGLLVGAARAAVLISQDHASLQLGIYGDREERVREAVRLTDEDGDPEERWNAHTSLGVVLKTSKRFDEAEAAHRRALEIAERSSFAQGVAGSTVNVGTIFLDRGEQKEARGWFERGLRLSREAGASRYEAAAAANLGVAAWFEGRLDDALGFYETALEVQRTSGDRVRTANFECGLGEFLREMGRLDEAHDVLSRALSVGRDFGSPFLETTASLELAEVLLEQGALTDAASRVEFALHQATRVGLAEFVVRAQLIQAELACERGDTDRARECLVIARDTGLTGASPGGAARAACHLAALAGLGTGIAREQLREASPRMRPVERIDALLRLCQATGELDDLRIARRELDAALARVGPATAASMRNHLRINRALLAACDERGV